MSDVSPLPDSRVERILAVTAHPDDVDFGAAGTVAAWTDAGIAVTYCVVTDGQAGGFDPSLPRDRIAGIRREEQRRAADVVGVEDVRFLGYADGELVASADLVEQLTRVIREVRPQRMLVPSPERDYALIFRSHPDHLVTGDTALQAIYPAARNPFAFPTLLEQGLQPWTVEETWLMAHPSSNHGVDVTATVDRKVAAVMAHTSQHPDSDGLEARMRAALERNARSLGLDGGYAEAFFVVPTG